MNATVLDIERLRSVFPDRESVVIRVLGVAASNYASTPDRLRALADEGNLREIVSLAHSLKGFAGTVFAKNLFAAAKEAETAARGGDPAAAGITLEMARHLEAVLREIRRYLESMSCRTDGG